MNFLLTALLLGVISMIIVFISGLTSGVVGIFTLILRACFAFAMTSAATYFLLMLFDYYEETQTKQLQKESEEITQEETPAETSEEQTPPPGFQPMNASNLPNVGK